MTIYLIRMKDREDSTLMSSIGVSDEVRQWYEWDKIDVYRVRLDEHNGVFVVEQSFGARIGDWRPVTDLHGLGDE